MEYRKRLPESLRLYLGLVSATVRVPKNIDAKIRSLHKEDVVYYEQLDRLLPGWRHALPDPKTAQTWQIYIPLNETHWLAVILGEDSRGSVNLISVFRIRTRNVRSRIAAREV